MSINLFFAVKIFLCHTVLTAHGKHFHDQMKMSENGECRVGVDTRMAVSTSFPNVQNVQIYHCDHC